MAEAATGIKLMIEPGEYARPLRILALGASTRELAAESSWRVADGRNAASESDTLAHGAWLCVHERRARKGSQ